MEPNDVGVPMLGPKVTWGLLCKVFLPEEVER